MRKIKVAEIQKCVCLNYNISLKELVGTSRRWGLAHPRQVGMLLTRELLGYSYPMVTRYFGKRDHTTGIAACRAVKRRCAANPDYQAEVDKLRGVLILLSQTGEPANDLVMVGPLVKLRVANSGGPEVPSYLQGVAAPVLNLDTEAETPIGLAATGG